MTMIGYCEAAWNNRYVIRLTVTNEMHDYIFNLTPLSVLHLQISWSKQTHPANDLTTYKWMLHFGKLENKIVEKVKESVI